MPKKDLPFEGSISGAGRNELNIDWGVNLSRTNSRSRRYSINGGVNHLTIFQEISDSLKVTGEQTQNATSGSNPKQVSFQGTANGKYICYSVGSLGQGVTITSAQEFSNDSGANFSTSYSSPVRQFDGGTSKYDFVVTLTVGADAPESTSTFTVYTNDTKSSPGASRAFTLNVRESIITVDSVEVSPSSVQIDAGNSFKNYHLTASVRPSGASQSVVWFIDSADTAKLDVNQNGYLKGKAVITTPIKVWAKSAEDSSKKDYCEVTYAPGTITMTNTSVAYNAVSATVPTSLYNIQTASLSIGIQGISWIHNASYDASNNQIVFLIDVNSNIQQRTATIGVSGTDWGGAQRYSQVFITQAGTGGVALTGLQVSGVDTIGDDGTTAHRYDLTYVPSDTTETGVTWQAIDPQGNSVEGTLVTLEKYADYCMMKVRPEGQASGATVWVQAVSNPHPQITGHKAVTVTYNRPLGPIQAEPQNVNVRWNATTDSTPVISYSGDTPTVISYSGIITSASLNSQTNVLTVTCTQNSDPFNYAYGSVVLGGPGYQSYTVNYTQGRADNPYAHTSVNISNMAVSGNAYPMMSANVNLNNGNGMEYGGFPGSFDWVLYGYESSSMVSGSQIASGTKTGYPTSVGANDTYAIALTTTSSVPTGNMTYFKLEVEMETYTIAPAYAELGDPGSSEITG